MGLHVGAARHHHQRRLRCRAYIAIMLGFRATVHTTVLCTIALIAVAVLIN
ncbi:hypothetical protein [Streptomyces sp. NPDC058812]|uniref:hypothetical protein n=1 Tax=unclassified Streptomyces TaxID=2593676 RepID=UPI003675B853